MTRTALRGLLQRKLRALLTALAVVLGVAMVSGTFMLTDSIQRAFDSIFTSSYAETDVVVSGAPVVEGSSSGDPTVPVALLPRIRALPGVEAAAGSLVDLQSSTSALTLTRADGSAMTSQGAEGFGFGVDPEHPRFIPLDLDTGAWAHGEREVVIDAGTARREHLAVGDEVGAAGPGGVERFRITGTARFGEVESLGGATVALFDLPTAQRLLRTDGYGSISVAARSGTSPDELIAEIAPLLPSTLKVESASARAEASAKEASTFIGYLRVALLAFGGIALFVGAFVIFNTISITIAQRTRELATLRTLGASRGQVLRSVLVETTAIGVLASLTGLGLGAGLATGLSSLFGAMGMALPQSSLVLELRTVVASLAVGVVVTVVASLVPAIRATRVAPIAAVREGSTAPPSRLAPYTPAVALALLALAASVLAYGLFAGGVETAGRLASIGSGTLLAFVAVGLLAPRLVRPLAAVVGWPSSRFGVAGVLARRNSIRQSGRTAASAAALMIGLALVAAVAVIGQGLRESATGSLDRQLASDYVVSGPNGDTVAPEVGQQIAALPGVMASSVRADQAEVAGASTTVTGVDPATIAAVYRFRFSQGSEAALATLADGGAIVRRSFASSHDLQVGDALTVRTPSDRTLDVRVEAIHDPGAFDLDPLLGSVLIDQASFDAAFPRPSDLYTFVAVEPGSEAMAAQAIAAGAERYPGLEVATREEFIASRVSEIEQILNLLYVLLGLSVVVSLFGMVNTLVLAVFERTRELGMLRAIGLSRRQTRRTVRHEAVVTALIGAALGLPLGVGLGALVTQALSGYGIELHLPVPTLAAFVGVAVVAGVLAAVIPARRAGRLDVLQALQYE